MKKIFLAVLIILSQRSFSQDKVWTWMHGSNIGCQNSIYGTMGVTNDLNTPGSRGNSISWTDLSGNLWLYGGNGNNCPGPGFAYFGFKSDLWKYNITTKQWVWANGENTSWTVPVYGTKGIPNPANKPGSRTQAMSWRGNDGNFWLYGGFTNWLPQSGGIAQVGDLWKYDLSTNQWSWESGKPFVSVVSQLAVYGIKGIEAEDNFPGAREGSSTWTDNNGDLWLFGGTGYDGVPDYYTNIGYRNDLWKYNLSTKKWTWISGDNIKEQYGMYGTKGIPNASNKPGSRVYGINWTDANGNLWLCGGYGYSSFEYGVQLNDIWMYNPTTNIWIWIGGSNSGNQGGVYGTKGVSNPANHPAARVQSHFASDSDGNLWLYGGLSGGGYYNLPSLFYKDLWKYDINTNEWTWESGDNIPDNASSSFDAIYGTRGVINVNNKPGRRNSGLAWIDQNNRFWLFGGWNVQTQLNDLWRFGTDPCFGNNFSVSIPDAKTLNYNSIANNTVYPPYAPASSITLSVQVSGGSGALNYSWSNGATTSSITVSPFSTTIYTVAVTDAVGCQVTASKNVIVNNLDCHNNNIFMCHISGNSNHVSTICIDDNAVSTHLAAGCSLGECISSRSATSNIEMETQNHSIQIHPNPSNNYFTIILRNSNGSPVYVCVRDILGRVVERQSNLPANNNIIVGNKLSPGVYMAEIIQGKNRKLLKLVKQ